MLRIPGLCVAIICVSLTAAVGLQSGSVSQAEKAEVGELLCGWLRVSATTVEVKGLEEGKVLLDGGNYKRPRQVSISWDDVGARGRVVAVHIGSGTDSRFLFIVLNPEQTHAKLTADVSTDYGCFHATFLDDSRVYAEDGVLTFVVRLKHEGAAKPETWRGRVLIPS